MCNRHHTCTDFGSKGYWLQIETEFMSPQTEKRIRKKQKKEEKKNQKTVTNKEKTNLGESCNFVQTNR